MIVKTGFGTDEPFYSTSIYECWVVGGSSRDRTITGFTPPNEHQTATTLDPLNVTYDPVKILKILKYFKSICL